MFAPLRIISGYSFLKSGLTIDKIAASVTKEGFSGAGLSDEGFLYGVPSFVEAMEKAKKGYLSVPGFSFLIFGNNLSK